MYGFIQESGRRSGREGKGKKERLVGGGTEKEEGEGERKLRGWEKEGGWADVIFHL